MLEGEYTSFVLRLGGVEITLSSNSTDYGFVPLLPLSGIENVERLDRVKIREHSVTTERYSLMVKAVLDKYKIEQFYQ